VIRISEPQAKMLRAAVTVMDRARGVGRSRTDRGSWEVHDLSRGNNELAASIRKSLARCGPCLLAVLALARVPPIERPQARAAVEPQLGNRV
jgi:hypothetical protein